MLDPGDQILTFFSQLVIHRPRSGKVLQDWHCCVGRIIAGEVAGDYSEISQVETATDDSAAMGQFAILCNTDTLLFCTARRSDHSIGAGGCLIESVMRGCGPQHSLPGRADLAAVDFIDVPLKRLRGANDN